PSLIGRRRIYNDAPSDSRVTPNFRLTFALLPPILSLCHEVRDRATARHPAVHSRVPARSRGCPHTPGNLRSLRFLLLWHGVQAPVAAGEEGFDPARLEPEARRGAHREA